MQLYIHLSFNGYTCTILPHYSLCCNANRMLSAVCGVRGTILQSKGFGRLRDVRISIRRKCPMHAVANPRCQSFACDPALERYILANFSCSGHDVESVQHRCKYDEHRPFGEVHSRTGSASHDNKHLQRHKGRKRNTNLRPNPKRYEEGSLTSGLNLPSLRNRSGSNLSGSL